MSETAVQERNKSAGQAVEVFRHQLDNMAGQFAAALPAHIPAERFARVVMTAVQNNMSLLEAKIDRRSLWNAAMKAAQDGLLPDGREGAIVVYGNQAQWMPMIAGIRKKVRNSGEIATWDVYVVYQNDQFEYELGDEPFIKHKPILGGEPGSVIAAYSVATLKSGEKSREVMSVAAIEKVRAASRAAKNGPWVTWYEEMCRKTVARRHSKLLPMSTDLDDLIRQDDDLYGFAEAKEDTQQTRPRSLAQRLDMLGSQPEVIDQDEVVEDSTPNQNGAPATTPAPASSASQEHQQTRPGNADSPKQNARAGTNTADGKADKPAAETAKPQAESEQKMAPSDSAEKTTTAEAGAAADPAPVQSAEAGEDAGGSKPASDGTAQPPASLTTEDYKVLRGFHERLLGAVSVNGLSKASAAYWKDKGEQPDSDTTFGKAVDDIYEAHDNRVHGKGSVEECDQVARKVTGR